MSNGARSAMAKLLVAIAISKAMMMRIASRIFQKKWNQADFERISE